MTIVFFLLAAIVDGYLITSSLGSCFVPTSPMKKANAREMGVEVDRSKDQKLPNTTETLLSVAGALLAPCGALLISSQSRYHASRTSDPVVTSETKQEAPIHPSAQPAAIISCDAHSLFSSSCP